MPCCDRNEQRLKRQQAHAGKPCALQKKAQITPYAAATLNLMRHLQATYAAYPSPSMQAPCLLLFKQQVHCFESATPAHASTRHPHCFKKSMRIASNKPHQPLQASTMLVACQTNSMRIAFPETHTSRFKQAPCHCFMNNMRIASIPSHQPMQASTITALINSTCIASITPHQPIQASTTLTAL
jgi:hypothetical protein